MEEKFGERKEARIFKKRGMEKKKVRREVETFGRSLVEGSKQGM